MANPILLLGIGAAALLMFGGKKKGAPAATTSEEDPFELEVDDELPDDLPHPPGYDPETIDLEGGAVGGLRARCDQFINAVWIDAEDDDELPINAIAVDAKVIPAIRAFISQRADEKGSYLSEADVLPEALMPAMESIAPGCGWTITPEFSWEYAGGHPIEGRAYDVMASLGDLVMSIKDDINLEKGYVKEAGLGGGGGQGQGFNIGD